MQQTEVFDKEYQLKANFVFAFILYCLFYRFTSASIVSAMGQTLFIFEEKDWIYKLFLALHIPQLITSGSVTAALFDVLWYSMPIIFLLTLQRRYVIMFFIVTLIYFLTFNMVTGHHYHSLAGMLIICLAFWSKKESRFNFLWEFARYYWLYIFASAALWKILRGSAFYPEQLSNILKPQQIYLLLQHPEFVRADIASYLISHPNTAHILLLVNVVVQLFFVVGFFTKKLDGFLFALAIVFVVANYFIMGIVSFELLVLNFTLLNWEKVVKLSDLKILKKLKAIYN